MNLDAISNHSSILKASDTIVTSKAECPWLVLGYNCIVPEVFTLEVSESGTKFDQLLAALSPDKILYAYLKLDTAIVDRNAPPNMKYVLILVAWQGVNVGDNILNECRLHLNKVRELVDKIDCEMCCRTVKDVLTHVENLKYTESFAKLMSDDSAKSPPNKSQISPPELHSRLNIVGGSGVGKTSIVHALLSVPFRYDNLPTTGFDISSMRRDCSGIRHELQIWDSAGQERFDSMLVLEIRRARAIVLVYSIRERDPFDECRKRFSPERLRELSHSDVTIMLLGNMSDLTNRVVTYEEGKEFAKQNDIPLFYEVSAKTGHNIKEAFDALNQLMIVNRKQQGLDFESRDDVIKLGTTSNRETAKCCK